MKKLLSLFAGLTAFAVFACPLPSAAAADYDVWSCRGPVGQPLSTEAWKPRASDSLVGDINFSNNCATGGAVELGLSTGPTAPRRPRLEFFFSPPPGEKIISYRLLRGLRAAALAGPGYFYYAAIREVDSGVINDFGCASSLALPNYDCGIQGSLSNPADPGNILDVNSVALDELGVFVSCAASGCNSPFPFAADAVLYEARVTIADNTPPVVDEIGGTLTSGRPSFGDSSLYLRATDDNAGIASISLDLDGSPYQTININSAACSEPYTRVRPCPAEAGRNFEIDTSLLAEGLHEVSGTVTDAAGNQTSFGPVNFTVEEPGPGTTNGTPAVRDPVLKLDPGSIWHRPGTRKVITGELSTQGGLAIAGANLRVQVSEFKSGWSAERDLPSVTTGGDGRFRVELGGQGARQVKFSFVPGADQAATAAVSTEVKTRLQLSLKANPRQLRKGKKATFRGRIVGAGPAAVGVPVLIQAKVAGKWSTIATTETRRGGNYRWNYRFKYVERNAVFSFRAVLGSSPGWPWASAKSAVRKVRVKVRR